MKATSSLLASLCALAACGNIVELADPATGDLDDNGIDSVDGIDRSIGDGSGGSNMPPRPPELPFLTEAPRAATSASSLFSVSFANAEIRNVIGETSADARYDILEQRIITTTDEPISVTISIAAPTGVYSRTIATDTVKNSPNVVGPTVLCADALYDYALPECNTAAPAKSASPTSGAISKARWKLALVNEATNSKVGSCVANGPFSITCALPGAAGVAYRVSLSADGFSELWNGAAGVSELVLEGKRFTGVLGALEFQCDPSLYEIEGSRVYCYGHWVYNRFTAIDAASLSFEPMSVTISAAGATKEFATPALTWDPGNDDLPGATY